MKLDSRLQMYLPNFSEMMGSTYEVINWDANQTRWNAFSISRTNWKLLNKDEEPCVETPNAKMSKCLMR